MLTLEIGSTGYDTRDRLTLSEFGFLHAGSDSNPPGQEIARFISTNVSPTLGDVSEHLVSKYGIAPERAQSDVAMYANLAQQRGYASLHTTFMRSFAAIVTHRILELMVLHPKDRRTRLIYTRRRNIPPTTGNVLLKVGSASLINAVIVVAAITLLLIGLAKLVGLPINPYLLEWYPFAVALTLITHGVAGVLHEKAHIQVAQWLGVPVHNLSVEGLRIGIQRARSSPRNEISITLAGPLVGIVASAVAVGVAIAAITYMQPSGMTRSAWALITLLPATAVITNASTLIPPSADGKALWYAIARVKTERPDNSTPKDK